MPTYFAKYLVNVINSNRQANICFRYGQIVVDPIIKRELYQLMQQQMELMDMNSKRRERAGELDLIITKSISRFVRNTVTVLKFARELENLGAGIF